MGLKKTLVPQPCLCWCSYGCSLSPYAPLPPAGSAIWTPTRVDSSCFAYCRELDVGGSPTRPFVHNIIVRRHSISSSFRAFCGVLFLCTQHTDPFVPPGQVSRPQPGDEALRRQQRHQRVLDRTLARKVAVNDSQGALSGPLDVQHSQQRLLDSGGKDARPVTAEF